MRRVLFPVIMLYCASALAQVAPTVVVEQDGSYGIAMAVNPKDAKVVVMYAYMKLWYSNDAGKTWQVSEFVPKIFGVPSIAADAKGNFFFADVTGNKSELPGANAVYVYRSDDGGKSWSEGEAIVASDKTLFYVNLGVHPKKEQVVVTWTESDTGNNCQSTLYFSSSTKSGKKFSEPVVIGLAEGNCADNASALRSATPELLFDGKLFVTWSQGGKIMLDRSYDHNMWLRNDITIRENTGSWMQPVKGLGTTSELPILTIDNGPTKTKGLISVVYAAKQAPGNSDIFIIRSGNRGDNWTTPSRVNQDSTTSDQFLPRFVTDQQRSVMYVLYYDRRAGEDTSTDVYLAWSADGGSTFKERKLSTQPSMPSLPENFVAPQFFSALQAVNGIVMASWLHWEGDKSRVMFMSIPQIELDK